MKQLKLKKTGNHFYIEGSLIKKIGPHSFYSHEESLRVIHYIGDALVDNLIFNSRSELREWVSGAVFKVEQELKLMTNHTLEIGCVLVANTDLKSPSKNAVRFYQITKHVDADRVILRELNKEIFTHENYKTAIPSVGAFANDELIEKPVMMNSIKLDNNTLVVRLAYSICMITDVHCLKVYTPVPFGIEA